MSTRLFDLSAFGSVSSDDVLYVVSEDGTSEGKATVAELAEAIVGQSNIFTAPQIIRTWCDSDTDPDKTPPFQMIGQPAGYGYPYVTYVSGADDIVYVANYNVSSGYGARSSATDNTRGVGFMHGCADVPPGEYQSNSARVVWIQDDFSHGTWSAYMIQTRGGGTAPVAWNPAFTVSNAGVFVNATCSNEGIVSRFGGLAPNGQPQKYVGFGVQTPSIDSYGIAVVGSNGQTSYLFGAFDYLGNPLVTVNGDGTLQTNVLRTLAGANVAAAGANLAAATVLTKEVNTVNSGTGGVRLPVAVAYRPIKVINTTGSPVNVYPVSGSQINALGASTAYALSAGSYVEFIATSVTQWYSK